MSEPSLSPAEAMRELRVGKTTLFKLLKSGALPFHKIGRKTLIRPEHVRALQEPGRETTCGHDRRNHNGGSDQWP